MTTIDDRIGKAARRIVRECAAVRGGEHVYIEGRLDSAEYLELLAFECELLGATTLVVPRSDEFAHRRLLELPPEQLERTSRVQLEAARAADVVFVVRMESGDPVLFADIAPERQAAAVRGRKPVTDQFFVKGRRWIGTDFPTSAQAAAFGLDFDGFSDMFWRSLDVDYGELRRKADALAAVLESANRVRITSPKGTDVVLGIAGRPVDKDVGVVGGETDLSNLPAGEVCLAPLEDQTDGTVVFDLAFWDGHRVEDLEVRFRAGRADLVGAAREFDFVRRVVAASTPGADVIGELGIGINPAVGDPCGYMLTDEKILGTVHLALGENEFLGGTNTSSLHWDMMILRPTLEVGETPVLVDGEWQL
jgi:aminopeptidase